MPEPPAVQSKFDPSIQLPTSNSIGALIRQGVYEFSGRDARDRLRDAIYWQENDIPHPSHIDFQEVHTGTATEIVQRVKGILADRPEVQVGTTSLSDMKSRSVEKVQDFANALFPALEDQADADTWDYVLEDIIRFGRGYDALEYVPGRWSAEAGYPTLQDGESPAGYDKRRAEFRLGARLPISWRHLPARGVYVWKDEGGIAEALSIEERRAADVAYRYNVPSLMKMMEQRSDGYWPVQHVIFCRYFNRKYASYWISKGWSSRNWNDLTAGQSLLQLASIAGTGEMAIAPFEHGYGMVPIIETSGITSTSKNPAKSQLSVLDHVLPLCQYLDQLVSQKASRVRVWAWPTPVLENMGINGSVVAQAPIGEDQRPRPIDIEPGKLLTLLPGEKISWLIGPADGAGADNLIEYITHQADMLGISSAVFDATALQSNGYLYNSVVNAIRSKYNPIIKHVQRGHRNRVQHALNIVTMHGEPLDVFKPGDGGAEVGEWLECGPQDIQGNTFQISVNYEDHLPTDDASDVALWTQVTDPNHPAMTDEDAGAKYLRIQDPKKNSDKLRIQAFERSDLVTQFLTAQALKAAGMQMDQQQGTPQDTMNSMNPEQQQAAPPAFMQALQGAGAQAPQAAPPGGVGGGSALASPTSAGGVPGAPVVTPLPGLNRAATPPPPGPGLKPGPKVHKKGGRAAGQSKAPPRQPAPRQL